MIFDSIDNIWRYGFTGNMGAALKYLLETDWRGMTAGKWDVDGDNIRLTLMDKDITEACNIWESHAEYADIHFLLSGREIMRTVDERDAVIKTPMNHEKDAAFFDNSNGAQAEFNMRPRDFIILYPGEIHQPNNVPDGRAIRLRKVILKVRVNGEKTR